MKELLKLFTNCKGQGRLTWGANRKERWERTQDLLYFIWWVLLTSTQSIRLPGKFFHQTLNNDTSFLRQSTQTTIVGHVCICQKYSKKIQLKNI